MATPTGGKTPIMPALEALLQQTANVAANVSNTRRDRQTRRESLFVVVVVCEEVESRDGRSRPTQHARHVT